MSTTIVTGTDFEIPFDNAPTGLVGTFGWQVQDGQGDVVIPRTTTGVVEAVPGSYAVTGGSTLVPGVYAVIGDTGGGSPLFLTEQLTVTPTPTADATLLELLDVELNRGGDASNYPPDEKARALQVATDAFQDEAKLAFYPTSRTETVRVGRYREELVMERPDITAVQSITGPDGPIDPAGIEIDDDELLAPSGYWTQGAYTVTYTHGLAVCPSYVQRAIVLIATSMLADGPWDDRGYAVDDGTGMTRLLTAGVSGAAFSIPEVQAALFRVRDYYVGS